MTTIVMYNSFLLWWRLRWRRRWRWQRWWRLWRRWRRCQPGLWGASNWRRKHFSGLDTSPPARSYLQFMVKRWSIDNFLTRSLSPIQECGTFVYDGLTTLEVDFLSVGKVSPYHHRHHDRHHNHLRPWWSDITECWLFRCWESNTITIDITIETITFVHDGPTALEVDLFEVGAEPRQVEQGKVADVETALRYVEVMVMMTGQKRNIMITWHWWWWQDYLRNESPRWQQQQWQLWWWWCWRVKDNGRITFEMKVLSLLHPSASAPTPCAVSSSHHEMFNDISCNMKILSRDIILKHLSLSSWNLGTPMGKHLTTLIVTMMTILIVIITSKSRLFPS